MSNRISIHQSLIVLLSMLAIGGSTLRPAAGDIYDLRADFSSSANPNGPWSFRAGTALLMQFPQPGDGNALNPVAGNGFLGAQANFSFSPFVLAASQNGSSAPPYSDSDFLAGDVLVHSTNPGGGEFVIEWTAPSIGTATYSGLVWYAHTDFVVRSNDWFVELNGGAAFNSGSITTGQDRNNASSFDSVGPLHLNAGDVLRIRLVPSSGEVFGSLSGVSFTVDFTSAIPEPSSCIIAALTLFPLVIVRGYRS